MLKKNTKIYLLLLAGLLLLPNLVLAVDPPCAYPNEAWNLQDIIDFIGRIRDFFLIIGILFIVIFLVWSGITYFTAGGDPEQIDQAKEKLKWSIIGAAVILATYVIISSLQDFLGKKWQ